MGDGESGYILTEIWKARPSWLALSQEERERFFSERVNAFLGSMLESGAEILGAAINDNTGSERIDYRYSPFTTYWVRDEVPFPVRAEDSTYHAKEVVLGVEAGDGGGRGEKLHLVAVPDFDYMRQNKIAKTL